MKKMIRMASLALALALGAASAQAEDFGFDPYAGVGLGAFNLDAGLGSAYAFGGFGFIGADINDYLAAEVRLGTTGTASLNVAGVPTESTVDWFVSYLGKLKLPVSEQVSLYGLVGATTLKTSWSIPGFVTLNNTSTTFTYGGGGEFKVNDQVHVGAEWVQYSMNANPFIAFPGLDAWGISGTVRYSF